MCNSVTDFANTLHTLETEDAVNQTCAVNEECDGVRCDVGGLFYEGFIVLPCARPPAVENVIEDANLHPLAQVIFDESGNYTIDGFGVNVTSFLERGPRSMSIEVCETIVSFSVLAVI